MTNLNLILSALIGATLVSVARADFSHYSKVNDKTTCQYKEVPGSDSGPSSCEFLCETGISGVKTKLLSCYDYEHLFLELDGSMFSTWEAMTKVGGLSGLGNKKGLVEWVLKAKESKGRDNLIGVIVRFNGVDQNSKNKSALAVFGLKKGEICWKGNFQSNEEARQGLNGKCKELIKAEAAKK